MTRRGFTIVEMMIAFVILGLLATVTLQGGRTMTQSAGEQVALEAVRAVVASGQSEAMRYPQATVAVALNGTRAQVLRDGTPVPQWTRTLPSGISVAPAVTAVINADGLVEGATPFSVTMTSPGATYTLSLDRAGNLRPGP